MKFLNEIDGADKLKEDSENRLVTDTEKAAWNGKQNALSTGTTSQFLRGDKTFTAVTKSNVGLGSVQNYGIATQAEAETATSNVKYMTPLRTEQAITKLARKGAAIIYQSTEPTEAQIAEYWYRTL